MRGPSAGYWKLTALLALGACGALIWRAPPAAAVQGDRRCEQPARPEGKASWSSSLTPGTAQAPRTGNLEALLSALQRATGGRARCRALTRLARDADEQALDVVLAYTEPRHPLELRVCATTALGEITSQGALAPLLGLLAEPVGDVSEAAARALAQRGDQESVGALVDVAQGADSRQAVTIAVALAESGAPEATALIASLLGSGNLRDRERLIAALGSGGVAGALPLLEKMITGGAASGQYAAISALGELGGPEAAAVLLRLLQQRPALAHMLAHALGRTQDPAAQKTLLALAETENRNQSSAAMQALMSFDDRDVHALMTRAMSSGEPNRMNMAMEYFANHPNEAVTTQLIALAQKSSPHTGYAALNALSRSDDPRARAVIEQLARGNTQLKSAAMMALSSLPDGAELARELALAQAKHGGPQLHQAMELLANDDSPEARATLIAVARRNDPGSFQALNWLGQRGDRESARVLEEVATASNSSAEQRGVAMHALVQSGDPGASKVLMRVLQTGDVASRAQAISALSQVAGPDVEQALLAASRDKESAVAQQAAMALGQLGTPSALNRMEELARGTDLQVTRHALISLTATPERAGPIARTLSGSENPEARLLAMEVATALPSDAASPILLAGIKDRDGNVVRMALGQLGAIGGDATTRAALLSVTTNAALPADVRERAGQLLGSPAIEPTEELRDPSDEHE